MSTAPTAQQLATLDRENIRFEAKDAGLRRDVHVLGALLGLILKEQGGDALFDAVERARKAAIRRRQHRDQDSSELEQLTDELPANLTRDFVRAFSTWFQVVNMAEQVHRIRRRRAHQRDTGVPQTGGLEALLAELKATGSDVEAVGHLLERLEFRPVFTAHPTEPTRRTLLRKQQCIARELLARLDPSMTPAEEQAGLEAIRAEITEAWQTEEHPSTRMSVEDELEQILFYLTDVLYQSVPQFYESMEYALSTVYGAEAEERPLPRVLRFGSLVGGDLAENENVTARTIKEALGRQRALILDRYHSDCVQLAQQLTQSRQRITVDPEVDRLIDSYAISFPGASHGIHARHRDMPYRVALQLIAARLQATFDGADRRYESAEAFEKDLTILHTSLAAHRGRHAGCAPLQRLLWQVRTFGFHLVTLDVRLQAASLRHAVAKGLGHDDWESKPPRERARLLDEALTEEAQPGGDLDAATRRTLGVIETLALCRRRFGTDAIGPLILNGVEGPDDLLAALLLCHWTALHDRQQQIPMDIVPLFERSDRLHDAPDLLRGTVEHESYRRHLAQRADQQLVMVGYADSSKENGVTAARWSIYGLQARMHDVLAEAGIALITIHARGGTISRGGGKTHHIVLGCPAGTVSGHLSVTEPGEMLTVNYGLQGIALRNLERALGSLAAAAAASSEQEREHERWYPIMDTIAASSRECYRGLVFGERAFATYFRQATPVDVIQRMQIGSGPVSTENGGDLAAMRSIPWVFAWTQSRCYLPGWYGIGTGLDAAMHRHGEQALKDMFTLWPFMQSFLDDLELALAKCDMDIFGHYNRLAAASLQHYYATICAEFQLTVASVLRLRGATELLESDQTLQRAIRLRNPYLDPISLLQVDLVKRWRAAGRPDDSMLQALFASVNGVAHALQNTG